MNFLCAAVTSTITAILAVASPAETPVPAAMSAIVDAAANPPTLDRVIDDLEVSASLRGNLLVLDDGEIIGEWSIGVSRADTGELITPDTRFEVASVAKPFTAVGVMVLVEKGLIGLDEPAALYLSGFPYPSVTIRQLLSHTSGMPGHESFIEEYWLAERGVAVEDLADWDSVRDRVGVVNNRETLAIFSEKQPELVGEPGTVFNYTNTGYWVLARIIEEVSGRSFAEFMQDEVFIPLGMGRTSILRSSLTLETAPPGVAVGEVQNASGEWIEAGSNADTRFVHFLAGQQGGVHVTTTARDLTKLLPLLRGESILSRESVAIMTAPGTYADGAMIEVRDWAKYAYGLGWKIDDDGTLWHDGDWAGYRAMIRLNPVTGDGMIYTLSRPPTNWEWLGLRRRAVESELARRDQTGDADEAVGNN